MTGHLHFGPRRVPLHLRFWQYVDRGPENECWEWRGRLTRQGYGSLHSGGSAGKPVPAHRVSYELLVGPIPEGLTLDHLCRNRACVNPAHLEPVTSGENVLRGEGVSAENARKTHCKHGHEFTPENTRTTPEGFRECRTCRRDIDRRFKAKGKVAA